MKIIRNISGEAYERGYEIADQRGTALVPLCPGNGHFNMRNIQALLEVTIQNFKNIFIFIPDIPTVHTYKALGYSEKRAIVKARLQGNNLRNRAKKVIDSFTPENQARVSILEWSSDIAGSTDYKNELQRLEALFSKNLVFREMVMNETRSVLKNKIKSSASLELAVKIGAQYVLEELSWLTSCADILDIDILSYVYHEKWFLDEYLLGLYDGINHNDLGIVIIK